MAKAKEKHQCCGQIFNNYHYHQCFNKGKVERDGKWFCGIHDPVKIAERDAVKRKQWDDERAERFRQRNLEERQQECTAKILSMLTVVDAVLLEMASATAVKTVRQQWPLLVKEAIECGLITDAS